jgi:hypothetical protein
MQLQAPTTGKGNTDGIVLVYSKQLSVSDAIIASYNASKESQMFSTAKYLRATVLSTFESLGTTTWPPTATELENSWTNEIPQKLAKFLTIVLSGKELTTNEDTTRLTHSIGEDICRAVTNVSLNLT